MKKIISVLLVLTIMVGIGAAFAEKCDRDVSNGGDKPCNRTLNWCAGELETALSNHVVNSRVCVYRWRQTKKHYECSRGHVKSTKTVNHQETGHSCGKAWDY